MMIKKYFTFINEDYNSQSIIDNDEFSQELTSDYSQDDYETESDNLDFYKSKLNELSEKLGEPVIDGAINYNGYKIIFPSETGMFHVNDKTFKTSDEVVVFLTNKDILESMKIKFNKRFL